VDKLRSFVKQRLANVGEFVLFDPGQPRRSQVAGGVAATPGSGAGELLMSQARIENGGMPGEGSPKEELALDVQARLRLLLQETKLCPSHRQFMSTKNQNSERRSGSRAPLKWVVLVYFDRDNWGKLVDLSESGMRFEFAQPPLDASGSTLHLKPWADCRLRFGGEIISDSFQAAGDVRWTRGF